jgi:hypothetical protein
MKKGQLVKQKYSGRIIRVREIDEMGINPSYTASGTIYEMFLENAKPLNFWERVKYHLTK